IPACPLLGTCLSLSPLPRPRGPPLFPYTTLFRSVATTRKDELAAVEAPNDAVARALSLWGQKEAKATAKYNAVLNGAQDGRVKRSEEHTSELQSRFDLVCRLLLEKKNKK